MISHRGTLIRQFDRVEVIRSYELRAVREAHAARLTASTLTTPWRNAPRARHLPIEDSGEVDR